MKKILLWEVIAIWVICVMSCIMCLEEIRQPEPVGLFVVRPDVNFFKCAAKVHGNYHFYYDPGVEEFMFDRGGELCRVNTMDFRVRYKDMFGRTPEIFVGDKNEN